MPSKKIFIAFKVSLLRSSENLDLYCVKLLLAIIPFTTLFISADLPLRTFLNFSLVAIFFINIGFLASSPTFLIHRKREDSLFFSGMANEILSNTKRLFLPSLLFLLLTSFISIIFIFGYPILMSSSLSKMDLTNSLVQFRSAMLGINPFTLSFHLFYGLIFTVLSFSLLPFTLEKKNIKESLKKGLSLARKNEVFTTIVAAIYTFSGMFYAISLSSSTSIHILGSIFAQIILMFTLIFIFTYFE